MRQIFLDEKESKKDMPKVISNKQIRCLNWNIQNPSLERATKQINWIEKDNFDAIILTEAKYSKAGLYIVDRLKSRGYT